MTAVATFVVDSITHEIVAASSALPDGGQMHVFPLNAGGITGSATVMMDAQGRISGQAQFIADLAAPHDVEFACDIYGQRAIGTRHSGTATLAVVADDDGASLASSPGDKWVFSSRVDGVAHAGVFSTFLMQSGGSALMQTTGIFGVPNPVKGPAAGTSVGIGIAFTLTKGDKFTCTFAANAPSAADFNADGKIDGMDLGVLLGQWGGGGSADFNGDGTVDGADLGMLLAAWTTPES